MSVLPKYLGDRDIASIWWCDQKFKYLAVENEGLYRRKIEILQGMENRSFTYVKEPKGGEIGNVEEPILDDVEDPQDLRSILSAFSFYPEEYVRGASDGLVNMLRDQLIMEVYPTLATFWSWNDYFIVTIPDGVSEEFCYVFRSVSKSFMAKDIIAVASAQADLCSFLFGKPKIRVQVRVRDHKKTETVQRLTDEGKVKKLLETAEELLGNQLEPVPPAAWKCRNCEYRERCEIGKEVNARHFTPI